MSPIFALRFFSTRIEGRFSSANRVIVSSISDSFAGNVGRVIDSADKSGSVISGITSHCNVAVRSVPSSNDTISSLGWLASFRPCDSIASLALSSSEVRITSPFTCSPKRPLTTDMGTFPGRKPGIDAVAAISVSFVAAFSSISAAVSTISYERLRPSFRVSVIFMVSLSCCSGRCLNKSVSDFSLTGAGGGT